MHPLVKAQLAEFMTRGFYDDQLARWLNTFPASAFLVLTYDEIQTMPQQVIERVHRFIGVSTDFVPSSLDQKPKQTDYAVPKDAKANRNKATKAAYRVYRLARKAAARGQDTHAAFDLSGELEHRLRSLFFEHIQRTDALLQGIPDNQRPSERLVDLWDYSE